MSLSRFEDCLDLILNHFEKDKITKDIWERWLGRPVSTEEINHLNFDQISPFYEERYWKKIHGNDLWQPLDLCLLDSAIHLGVGSSIKILQKCLQHEIDGIFRPNLLNAIKNIHDHQEFLQKFLIHRLEYLSTFRQYHQFEEQWKNRLTTLSQWLGLVGFVGTSLRSL